MTKRAIAPVEGARVRLRLLQTSDLSLTRAWRNQDHIRQWFFSSGVITAEQHQAWFENYRERDDDFVFIIEARATQTPIGQVALYHIDWAKARAEFGRLMIGEPFALGKGFAHEATMLLVAVAFDVFNLREVYLEVLAHNTPARAIYEKCGFVLTAQRDNVIVMTKSAKENL